MTDTDAQRFLTELISQPFYADGLISDKPMTGQHVVEHQTPDASRRSRTNSRQMGARHRARLAGPGCHLVGESAGGPPREYQGTRRR